MTPGADFFRYASGTWLKTTQIPPDKAGYSMFTQLGELSDAHIREILEAAHGDPGSDAQKVGDYYRTFMDDAAIEAQGIAPIEARLDDIARIKTRGDLVLRFAAATRRNGRSPVAVEVRPDDRAPDQYLAAISQSGIGLPDRDMYEPNAPQFAKLRDGYRAYITQMFELVGDKDAATRAAGVYALEAKLAHVHWTRVEVRDPQKTYNKLTLAELQKLAPDIDWKPWLQAVGLASQPVVNVHEPSAIARTAALIQREPISVWKDYLRFAAISGAARYLPKRFVDAQFEMYGKTLNGLQQNSPRWERAISDTVNWLDNRMGQAVAPLYIAKHFPPETKAHADQLVQNVLTAMGQRIDGLTWMSAETKAKAKAKLARYHRKIGYPDKWREFSALSIVAGDAVGNAARLSELEYARQLAKLGQPIDRDEWEITPMTINAYYSPTLNEIAFPAAILQPPFFDANADDAVNYGAIGSVIGHEISHGFDDRGAQYDGDGALHNWWTKDDADKFQHAAAKLVEQYNAYCPFPAADGKPAQCVNGTFTLGENIADLAGLTVAYTAYHLALGGKPAPVLDGLTGDQRFFLGFAQAERELSRPEFLANRLVSDPHTPDEFRTSVVRNLDAWYDAFHVQPGDALYLPPDQRVRIW